MANSVVKRVFSSLLQNPSDNMLAISEATPLKNVIRQLDLGDDKVQMAMCNHRAVSKDAVVNPVIAWHCFLWSIRFIRIGTIFVFKAVSQYRSMRIN